MPMPNPHPPIAVVLVAADIYADVGEWMKVGRQDFADDPALHDVIDPAQSTLLERERMRPWLAQCGVRDAGSPYGQVLRGLLYAGVASHAIKGHEDRDPDRARRRLGQWAGVKGQHLLCGGLHKMSVTERRTLLEETGSPSLLNQYPFADESLRGALAVIRTDAAIRATGLDLGLRLGTIAEDQLCHTDLVVTARHHPEGGGVLVQVKAGRPDSVPDAFCTRASRPWHSAHLPLSMRQPEFLALGETMWNEAYRRGVKDRLPWNGLIVRTDSTPCASDDPALLALADRLRVLLMETGRFGPGVGMPAVSEPTS